MSVHQHCWTTPFFFFPPPHGYMCMAQRQESTGSCGNAVPGKALLMGEGNQGVASAVLGYNTHPPELLVPRPGSFPPSALWLPQGGVPETAAVSSCTFSFNLSQGLKLQLPGICSLWLFQRERLFEK